MNDILDFIRSAAPWVAIGLAVAILAVRGAVPEGLKLYRFPESDWAVFSCKGPAPRLAAGAQHLRLADLVSGRGAAGRGERGRRAAGAFISDGAVGSVAGMPAVRHAFYQGRQGLYAADPGPLPAGLAGRDQLYV